MKTFQIYAAHSSASKGVESTTIEIAVPYPVDSPNQPATVSYAAEAKVLREALRAVPVGTIRQLISLLLLERTFSLVSEAKCDEELVSEVEVEIVTRTVHEVALAIEGEEQSFRPSEARKIARELLRQADLADLANRQESEP